MAYFDARANSVTTVELPRVISELIRVRNITHSVPCEEPLSRKQAPARKQTTKPARVLDYG
jgi:hypothetical protein